MSEEKTDATAFEWREEPNLLILNHAQDHKVSFYNEKSEMIGSLDLSGDTMKFAGDLDESAKIFFRSFAGLCGRPIEFIGK